MTRMIVRSWLALLALAALAHAALPEIEHARRNLAEGLPQIAAEKIRRVLRQPKLSAPDRRDATLILAESLLEDDQAEAARKTVRELSNACDEAAQLIEAHALARQGEWPEALQAYGAIASRPDAPVSVKLGQAEALQALGSSARALAVLQPLLSDKKTSVSVRLRAASLYVETNQIEQAREILSRLEISDPGDRLWASYVEGRILLAEEQPAAALELFNRVIEAPTHRTLNLYTAATLGLAEAKFRVRGPDAADKQLETFIWRNPDSAWLDLVFRRLDQVYAAEKNPTESEFRKWAQRSPERRAALAKFYHAALFVRSGKIDKALDMLALFLVDHPNHRLVARANLIRADELMKMRRFAEALAALDAASRSATSEELRGEIEMKTGLAQFQQREFVLAAGCFERAAGHRDGSREIALYNAALAWLSQGNDERFQLNFTALGSGAEGNTMRGLLRLEQGLSQARFHRPEASETLRRFLGEFPRHPRADEARLALAELAYAAGDLNQTTQMLLVAATKPREEEFDDHAAYLAITQADGRTPPDDAEVIRLCSIFLRQREKSTLVPEVRMKLGQVYFRQSNYPSAEYQFGTLANESPRSPYAETALFLAGQCAMRTLNPGTTERALRYFDQVVEMNGALKFQARLQQALIYVQLNKEPQAIALYDLILDPRAPVTDPELRASAVIGKGDVLVALGRTEPSRLIEAMQVFDQLATPKETRPSWRHQAIYKKAKVLDQLGRFDEALLQLNQVLDETIAAKERDYFWFYKCGFEAASELEQKQNWSGAIAVYEKVGRLDGPRAEEARSCAKSLRVEHFVWD